MPMCRIPASIPGQGTPDEQDGAVVSAVIINAQPTDFGYTTL
jgi:hypothetical protein